MDEKPVKPGNPYAPPVVLPPAAGSSEFAACPACGAASAERVRWTWWGGILGPKLLCHVRCSRCQTAYNGRSGRPNTSGIVLYTLVGLFLGFIIFATIALVALL